MKTREATQFQGIESCRFTGSVGPVGDFVQAAAVPSRSATNSKRKMEIRDMGRVQVEVGSMNSDRACAVLTRYVTNYYAM